MPPERVWLWGQKKFQNYFRALTRCLPPKCRNLLLLPSTSQVNYTVYLSNLLQKNKFKIQDRSLSSGAPSSPKVPPPGGTFSFPGEDKFILVSEINKIPSRYRAGLIRLIEKYKSRVYFCSIIKPNEFNYSLAEKSDIYYIHRRSWLPVIRELKSAFNRLMARGESLPDFPPRFTLREKLIMRLLYRFRRRFVKIDEISSYIYGRRLNRNIHASEAIVANLRKKIEKLSGNKQVLRSVRNFGYHLNEEVWEKLTRKS